jgi:hypothetical protein
MNRARVAAALAALLTALLLQATLIGPVTMPLPVSLPALLVAAIALVDGPGAGLAFGFAIGLIADLGSEHPAGVLALCWLLDTAVRSGILATLVDLGMALALVPLVRLFLHSDTLRAPRPVLLLGEERW